MRAERRWQCVSMRRTKTGTAAGGRSHADISSEQSRGALVISALMMRTATAPILQACRWSVSRARDLGECGVKQRCGPSTWASGLQPSAHALSMPRSSSNVPPERVEERVNRRDLAPLSRPPIVLADGRELRLWCSGARTDSDGRRVEPVERVARRALEVVGEMNDRSKGLVVDVDRTVPPT
eukprot:scaffold7210_cov32-Tisochrysis_lutea.AAC.8